MAKEIEISDLNILIKDLSQKQKNVKKALKNGVKKTTYDCQKEAKKNAPVDTGNLRLNIHAKVKESENSVTGAVEPTMEYSVYPEFGTGQKGMSSSIEKPEGISYSTNISGQEAQPYMYPAYVQQREKMVPNIKKELDKILKEVH